MFLFGSSSTVLFAKTLPGEQCCLFHWMPFVFAMSLSVLFWLLISIKSPEHEKLSAAPPDGEEQVPFSHGGTHRGTCHF